MQQPVKVSIVQEILEKIGHPDSFDTDEIMQKLKQYEQGILERDLQALNSTLLPSLQIKIQSEKQNNQKVFTKEYLGLSEKTYSYVKLIDNKQDKINSKERQQLPPFLPNYNNYNDINANSKQLLKKSSIGVGDKTPNLSFLLASTIKSTFNGEHKATYPTIIYEGSEPHPIRNYGGSKMYESKTFLYEGLKTLGGMRDSLSKLGMESVSNKKRKTLSSSKYSQINQDNLRLSNTRMSKIQQPPAPQSPIHNPFIRRPSQKK